MMLIFLILRQHLAVLKCIDNTELVNSSHIWRSTTVLLETSGGGMLKIDILLLIYI